MNFNEPISILQRMIEDMLHVEVLEKAAACDTSLEELAYLAVFSVACYGSVAVATRLGKPFNPLLGETYECDRRAECGWRAFSEQVSSCISVIIICPVGHPILVRSFFSCPVGHPSLMFIPLSSYRSPTTLPCLPSTLSTKTSLCGSSTRWPPSSGGSTWSVTPLETHMLCSIAVGTTTPGIRW